MTSSFATQNLGSSINFASLINCFRKDTQKTLSHPELLQSAKLLQNVNNYDCEFLKYYFMIKPEIRSIQCVSTESNSDCEVDLFCQLCSKTFKTTLEFRHHISMHTTQSDISEKEEKEPIFKTKKNACFDLDSSYDSNFSRLINLNCHQKDKEKGLSHTELLENTKVFQDVNNYDHEFLKSNFMIKPEIRSTKYVSTEIISDCEEEFFCHLCSKTFKTLLKFTHHISMHTTTSNISEEGKKELIFKRKRHACFDLGSSYDSDFSSMINSNCLQKYTEKGLSHTELLENTKVLQDVNNCDHEFLKSNSMIKPESRSTKYVSTEIISDCQEEFFCHLCSKTFKTTLEFTHHISRHTTQINISEEEEKEQVFKTKRNACFDLDYSDDSDFSSLINFNCLQKDAEKDLSHTELLESTKVLQDINNYDHEFLESYFLIKPEIRSIKSVSTDIFSDCEEEFFCHLCSKTFKTTLEFTHHISTHTMQSNISEEPKRNACFDLDSSYDSDFSGLTYLNCLQKDTEKDLSHTEVLESTKVLQDVNNYDHEFLKSYFMIKPKIGRTKCESTEIISDYEEEYFCHLCSITFKTTLEFTHHISMHTTQSNISEEDEKEPILKTKINSFFDLESFYDSNFSSLINLNCLQKDTEKDLSHTDLLESTKVLKDISNYDHAPLKSYFMIKPETKSINCVSTEINSDCALISKHEEHPMNPLKYTRKESGINVSCLSKLNPTKDLFSQTSKITGIEKEFFCHLCSESFKTTLKLAHHISKHTTQSNNSEELKEEPISETKKNIYFDLEINKSPKQALMCPYCSAAFKHTSKLKRHVKTHTSLKPYACHICSKKFLEAYNFISHIQIHTDEQPYLCDICCKSFNFKSNLNRHMRSHNKETFLCSECGNTYTTAKHLAFHFRTHLKKIYKCTECEKVFKRISNLNRHRKIHSSERMYSCNQCSYRARNSYHLKRHTQRLHKS